MKIFAKDETGVSRPVSSCVTVFRPGQSLMSCMPNALDQRYSFSSPPSPSAPSTTQGRLLDTAREAARFVSLFPVEQSQTVGGDAAGAGRLEQWCHLHTILARASSALLALARTLRSTLRLVSINRHFPPPRQGAGDVEDHAVLLCSLLLGFGMDAFVCVGTKVSLGEEGGGGDDVEE